MITENAIENLDSLAAHCYENARRLESAVIDGATELAAPSYWRAKGDAFREAKKQMLETPQPEPEYTEEPSIAWQAAKYALYAAAAGSIFCGALLVALGVVQKIMEAMQ